QADSMMAGAEFLGDPQVGGVVRVGGAEDDAGATNKGLRGGGGAGQAMQFLTLLVGKGDDRCMGGRHGGCTGVGGGLDSVLLAIRTHARRVYEKLSRDLRNAVLRDEFACVAIDFGLFVQKIAGAREILRTYYYDCLPYQSRNPTTDERERFGRKQRF